MLLFFSPHKNKLQVGKTNMSPVSLTPLRPLKALVLLKMTTALHLPLCLFHYNEHASVPAFRSGGQSEGKALLILQAVWLMDSLTLSLGLRGPRAQHGSAHHGLMFLINQCHWPLMEPQLLLPVRQSMSHPCLLWQQCLHLVIDCSFTKPECSFHCPINEYI